MYPTFPKPAELAERIKAEIIQAVRAGVIPATVRSFAQLHDYVDANCLGGTEKLWETLPVTAHGDIDGPARDDLCDLTNAAHNAIDAWIKAGGVIDGMK